ISRGRRQTTLRGQVRRRAHATARTRESGHRSARARSQIHRAAEASGRIVDRRRRSRRGPRTGRVGLEAVEHVEAVCQRDTEQACAAEWAKRRDLGAWARRARDLALRAGGNQRATRGTSRIARRALVTLFARLNQVVPAYDRDVLASRAVAG